MKVDDCRKIHVDCDGGSLKISAWAKDRAGNAPFVSFQTDSDSGHASFSLKQARLLADQLSELVRELEDVR